MSTAKQIQSKGRPKFTALKKERREAARRLKVLSEIREEYDQILALDSRTEDEAREIQQIADERRDICRSIDMVSDQIRHSRETGQSALEEEQKEIRSALYDKLNEYPELGYTYSEWRNFGSENKVKELGRPKLRIEQRLNRAETAFQEQEVKLREVERKQGAKHISIAKVVDKVILPGVGRPPLTEAARLDRKLLKLEEEIEFIQSGKAQEERDAIIQERMTRLGVTDPVDLPGRPMTPLHERLDALKARYAEGKQEMDALLSKMSEVDRLREEVDSYKIRLRAMKRRLKQEGGQPSQLTGMIKTMESSVSLLEKTLAGLQGSSEGAALVETKTATQTKEPELKESAPEVNTRVKAEEAKQRRIEAQDSNGQGEKVMDVKAQAKAEEQQKAKDSMASMSDVLSSLLEEINMEVSDTGEVKGERRSRLRDRLIPKVSNG